MRPQRHQILIKNDTSFLTNDAFSLCIYKVSICPSVCPSVRVTSPIPRVYLSFCLKHFTDKRRRQVFDNNLVPLIMIFVFFIYYIYYGDNYMCRDVK